MYTFVRYEPTEILRNHLNLGGENPEGERIDVTNLYFERNGKPWIGTMGEYHFERDNRENWYKELCKMKAGGIDIVSTYIIWIYHEEIEGEINFEGDNDIREFVLCAKRADMDVFLRIGPWAHGEARNGGFPNWLLRKTCKLRDNNEEYLALIGEYYTAIYNEVSDLFYSKGGNIIGVQIENEFVNSAEHLAKLKEIALEIGYEVPLWTVTGWNSVMGAKIPVDEYVPVFGGYVETPWVRNLKQLPPSIHFFFNKMRNDTAIGADLISGTADDDWKLPYEKYPFATCELGSGTQNTHHRRAIMHPMDVYAMSLVKLGSGNNLIGYYMYHGGTNKIGKLSTFQESTATGYPNDVPMISYDFQAPVSEYGEIREHYRLLNILHMFVKDFGDILAPMETVMQSTPPLNDDRSSLRYAMRTDGRGGFIFVNHHQRFDKLKNIHNVIFDTGINELPPIDVCGDNAFMLPFNVKMGTVNVDYALAQPICKVNDAYFFMEIEGIKPIYMIAGKKYSVSDFFVKGTRFITLKKEEVSFARKLDGKLYIGCGCDIYYYNGKIKSAQPGDFAYKKWNGLDFDIIEEKHEYTPAQLIVTDVKQPFVPKYGEELSYNCERKLWWKRLEVDNDNGFVELDEPCDVMQIYVDSQLVADEFWYGIPKRLPAKLLFGKECYAVFSELKDDFYREF